MRNAFAAIESQFLTRHLHCPLFLIGDVFILKWCVPKRGGNGVGYGFEQSDEGGNLGVRQSVD